MVSVQSRFEGGVGKRVVDREFDAVERAQKLVAGGNGGVVELVDAREVGGEGGTGNDDARVVDLDGCGVSGGGVNGDLEGGVVEALRVLPFLMPSLTTMIDVPT